MFAIGTWEWEISSSNGADISTFNWCVGTYCLTPDELEHLHAEVLSLCKYTSMFPVAVRKNANRYTDLGSLVKYY